jgi:tRNA(adenine34) deaminase
MMTDDERWMAMAIKEAQQAARIGEIPIGAVVVSKGRVIGKGHNLTESLNDVTAHAEIQAITAAAEMLGGKYLTDCTLYVTVEPCLMCAGAIAWAQVPRVVYGASDEKRGYSTLVTRKPFHPRAEVISGVLADECANIMRTFFMDKRR